MRRITSAALAATLLAPLARSISEPPAPQRAHAPRNVLVILADQHHARTLGVSGNGFGGLAHSLTPSLDRLAAEGVRFENAYCASPQCCPSRYTLLNGLWPHAHGLRANGIWETRPTSTFPELARAAGYATATIGKHHMAWLEQPTPLFEDHGFAWIVDLDEYAAFCAANSVPSWTSAGNHWSMPGLPAALENTGYTFNSNEFHPDGYFATEVLRFLDERAGPGGDGRPFVCWFAPFGPHTPLLPSGPADPHDWAHRHHPFDALALPPNLHKLATTERLEQEQQKFAGVSEEQWREVLSYYYGLISQIDWNVGRVLDRLDELGLAEDTLVIYTADHGEMASEMSCWTKGTGTQEAITRVPLLLRLPGIVPAGGVVDALVEGVDLVPTLLEVTGVPVSDARRAQLAGHSLLELAIRGAPPASWRREAFCEFGSGRDTLTRMVRSKQGKYAFDELGEPDDEELYDLAADPWELEDLLHAPTYGTARLELRAALEAWWNDAQGHAPSYARAGEENARPTAPRDPLAPADGAVWVARDVDPSWIPSSAAQDQSVYLGSNPAQLELVAELGHMQGAFNPGTLAAATTYYWRVDGRNANGTAPGHVWRFTTAAGGPGGPALAGTPAPAPGAQDVPRPVLLTWSPAPDAVTQTLVFARAGEPEQRTPGLPGTLGVHDPGPLLADATYRWRIDGTSAAGTTLGTEWSFTTSANGLPEVATLPRPGHLETLAFLPARPRLGWRAGAGVEEHDVHFGTSFPLPLVATTTKPELELTGLTRGTTYYWRVDERNDEGTRLGWTWRFTLAD